MGKLGERLSDPARSGVYRSTRLEALEDAVRGTRLNYTRISLAGVEDRESMLAALSRELAFPAWFGGNWDALEDCLSDLSWIEAAGHLIVFEDFQAVLTDELGVLIDVLSSAAEFWAAQKRPFFAVFLDPERSLGLADLWREVKPDR